MGRKTQKVRTYLFTLENINIISVNNKYNISAEEDDILDKSEKIESSKTTRLSDLNTEKGTPEVISFLDESKRAHTCHTSMIDFISRLDVNLLRYHCYWCKHPFDTRPIGCPIRYVSSQAEKKYYSHISRDSYTIKENVTTRRRKKLDCNSSEINIKVGEYYETDGIFCSFNCCQAWINENKHNRLYDMSTVLLMKMYNNIMQTVTIVINPAPHWRTLEQYGGHLNILKFREGFNKVDYTCHGKTKIFPKFVSIGVLYEENIRF